MNEPTDSEVQETMPTGNEVEGGYLPLSDSNWWWGGKEYVHINPGPGRENKRLMQNQDQVQIITWDDQTGSQNLQRNYITHSWVIPLPQ